MREFKGKCEWGIAWVIIGIVSFILVVYFCVLFGIGSTRGLKGGVIFAVITGAFLGVYSIVIFLSGVSRIKYTNKPALRIYEDRIEFLERKLFSNAEWAMVNFADIKNFSVNKFVSQNDKSSLFIDTAPGTIEFEIKRKGKREIQLDIEECFEAAKIIIDHLTVKQINTKKSELTKEVEESSER